MSVELITKLEVDITAAKAAVASWEAQLAAATSRLNKLLAAREVYASYVGAAAEGGGTTQKSTLAYRIEQALLTNGPAAPVEIHQKLSAIGVNTTQGAVNTTLSRMKASRRVTNVSGRWQVVSSTTTSAAPSGRQRDGEVVERDVSP